MIKQKLKLVRHIFLSNINKYVAKISLIKINNGFYTLKMEVPYISQFIEITKEAEINNIKIDPTKLVLHGYKTMEDFVFWGRRACGIICIKMLLEANELAKDLKIFDLIQEGLKLKGYIVNNESGEFTDIGWFHKPLLKLGQSLGLKGRLKKSQTIENLALEVIRGNFAVISVKVPQRNDLKEDGSYFDENYKWEIYGHLILLTGVQIEKHKPTYYTAHNPTGYKNYEMHSKISAETMKRIFKGQVILFYN